MCSQPHTWMAQESLGTWAKVIHKIWGFFSLNLSFPRFHFHFQYLCLPQTLFSGLLGQKDYRLYWRFSCSVVLTSTSSKAKIYKQVITYTITFIQVSVLLQNLLAYVNFLVFWGRLKKFFPECIGFISGWVRSGRSLPVISGVEELFLVNLLHSLFI